MFVWRRDTRGEPSNLCSDLANIRPSTFVDSRRKVSLPRPTRKMQHSDRSSSLDALTTVEAFNTMECALLSTTAQRPVLHVLSTLLHHTAAVPCSGPLVITGCVLLMGNASRYDERLLTTVTHAANATRYLFGESGLAGLTADIASLTADALGVPELVSLVEEVASETLDALGVPECVFSRKMMLPALFGLLYGGAEPTCDVPELRAFREHLLATDDAALLERLGEAPKECPAQRKTVRFDVDGAAAARTRRRKAHSTPSSVPSSPPATPVTEEERVPLKLRIEQLQAQWEPVCTEDGECPPFRERFSIYYDRWWATTQVLFSDRNYRIGAFACVFTTMFRGVVRVGGSLHAAPSTLARLPNHFHVSLATNASRSSAFTPSHIRVIL